MDSGGTYLVEVAGSVATVPWSVNNTLNDGHRMPLILHSMCAQTYHSGMRYSVAA